MVTLETLRFNLLVVPLIVFVALVGKRVLALIPPDPFNRLLPIRAGLAALHLVIP